MHVAIQDLKSKFYIKHIWLETYTLIFPIVLGIVKDGTITHSWARKNFGKPAYIYADSGVKESFLFTPSWAWLQVVYTSWPSTGNLWCRQNGEGCLGKDIYSLESPMWNSKAHLYTTKRIIRDVGFAILTDNPAPNRVFST